MRTERQYALQWKFPYGTVIRCLNDDTAVELKSNYHSLCYGIGIIGWLPSILFKTTWEISNVFLRIIASVSCYFSFALFVIWLFHRFLIRKNRNGELEKFIEMPD